MLVHACFIFNGLPGSVQLMRECQGRLHSGGLGGHGSGRVWRRISAYDHGIEQLLCSMQLVQEWQGSINAVEAWEAPEWAVVAQKIQALNWVSYGSAKFTGHRSLCSSCESGRGIFTLSRHGRPLEWAVVAQEVWRWPDSQVDTHDDVWPACLLSLGLPSGAGNSPFIEGS